MDLLIGSKYSFLAGCLQEKPKYSLPYSFASITAFRIIWIHPNRRSIGGEGMFGSNKTAEILKQLIYVIYLVCRKAPLTRFRTRLLSKKSAENWVRNRLSNLAPQNCSSFIYF
jgi:hypothetical protein